jgi:hypothetical protein
VILIYYVIELFEIPKIAIILKALLSIKNNNKNNNFVIF